MKPPPFVYHDPTTVAEATELIGRLDNWLVLAGGQSLMPMLNFRVVAPDHLIDLNRIKPLSHISMIGDILCRFGSMTRQRDLEFSADVQRAFPIIPEALQHVGHRQTRNRGTFGGSLCTRSLGRAGQSGGTVRWDPAGHQPRRQPAHQHAGMGHRHHDQFAAARRNSGRHRSADLAAGHGYAFEEFARRHGDFAIAVSDA
jgi:aerobic carbon-monoxide dehydrogenase medium subunit